MLLKVIMASHKLSYLIIYTQINQKTNLMNVFCEFLGIPSHGQFLVIVYRMEFGQSNGFPA